MSSNPTAASSYYQYVAASPLDQIMNGNHPIPPRHTLLDRAMTLTRKTSVKSRYYNAEDAAKAGGSTSTMDDNDGSHDTTTKEDDNYGYALGGENNEIYQYPAQAQVSNNGGIRQKVQDLRAARLSQQQSTARHSTASTIRPNPQPSHARNLHESTMISNAFRDSVASDMSFNSISTPDERYSMAGGFPSTSNYGNDTMIEEDPNRIADAVRDLTLRRRQSIDTVRSSEFGEGGKWDRAWGGSDDEEDDEAYDARQMYALPEFDIEGRTGQAWGALDHISQGQQQSRDDDKRRTLTADHNTSTSQLPTLQSATGVEHVVSLMPSMQRTKQTLGVPAKPAGDNSARVEAGSQPQLQRRDTVMSMAGDVGQVSPTPPQQAMHRYTNSNATINSSNQQDYRSSYSSDSSRSNAHVYVWPPTPAASEHGGSNEDNGGQKANSQRDTLLAHPAGVGIGQRAVVEYADEQAEEVKVIPQATSIHPMSPSSALARPLDSPILGPDGKASRKQKSAARVSSGSGSGHPTGRLPPQPPVGAIADEEDRYGDPNKRLSGSPYGELGRMRRKAIEDRDGRESLVSDLDVETLRLDGSSVGGGSDEWDSRRGSVSSVGSFSSDKIRDQRQRRSQASIISSYTDKRSSSGTIQDQPRTSPSREVLHQSWNGAVRRGETHPSLQTKSDDSFARRIGQPKRSNTGPDSYQAQQQSWPQQPGNNFGGSPLQQPSPASFNSSKAAAKPNGGSSLTFSTPRQPEREAKSSVTVKGATNNSQAEKFLTLAITHHETGDLSRSAYYFERSAKVEGGCVVGMCMWGMALREGWGVRKDQKKGFDWISRAAARAGEMMAGSQGGINKSEAELKAIRSELKLSVYELGKCFCYGWGVKMDKPMALEYFELAAKLGDSDAQAEAGALLAAGKGGCKKDLKKAAMYYRMAEAQGYDTVGLSWIHKDKYDPVPGSSSTK